MIDIGSIASLVGSLKTASDITKAMIGKYALDIDVETCYLSWRKDSQNHDQRDLAAND
jgi:hypothetical protein